MTRRTGSALPLLFSLCVAPVAGVAAHDAAEAAVSHPAATKLAFLAELSAATDQAISGDTLGAAIAFEQLLDDPRLATLDDVQRSHAWHNAALVAGEQKQVELAERRLQTALSINPRNADARFLLAAGQLANEQVQASANNVIRGIADSEGAPDLPKDLVWHLDRLLKDMPATRLPLLQGLFDHGWKSDDLEPGELWVTLATLQVEAGQHDKVSETLARVDEPFPLVMLRSDKRFDRHLERGTPRVDPVGAAQRQIDRLRVATMLAPGINDTAVELAFALLVAGQPQDVIGMTQSLADYAPTAPTLPKGDEARSVGWMLELRGRAQRQLGQNDAALDTQVLAVRMAEDSGLADQPLGLAYLYAVMLRPSMARETVRDLKELNAYGEGARQLINLMAALQVGDSTAAQGAREVLSANRQQTPGIYMTSLIADNRLDEAAATLLARLADPTERGAALLEMQSFRMSPRLPGEVAFQARWKHFAQRTDVQAAVNKVGRVETYALYND
ncbi:hypothetical protein EDF74_3540 [Stenotrophomonas rhizophila]|uniref:hypothetical protein n=1 Tax=Stenotrophomonas rhizophila TaxID=216778 RepID=UPI000F4BD498|nr:hypothetical protein [Stenotrophomonas rhizophila]ROP73274.1 hypothetical protein EDF74_3540 [Stenotrophomonas rhizophila]